jgi:hypothetical protein
VLRGAVGQGKYQVALISQGGLSADPDYKLQSFDAQAPVDLQDFTRCWGYANELTGRCT